MALNEVMLRLIEDDNVTEFKRRLEGGFPADLPLNAVSYRQFHMSPLHVAASHGSANVSAALLSAGGNPNIADTNGRRPLHYAAANGHLGVIHLLVSNGADPNALTNVFDMQGGDTPLIKAASFGREEAVELLLSSGADPSLRNILGQAAVDLARMSGRRNLAEGLQRILDAT
jgi:ankyrin repeat protein